MRKNERQMRLLYNKLRKDMDDASQLTKEHPSKYRYKVALLTFITFVESVTFLLSQELLKQHDEQSIRLSFHEEFVLREKYYTLNDEGDFTRHENILRRKGLYKFTLNQFGKHLCCGIEIDFKVKGAICLDWCYDQRNRTTHPRSGSDLDVIVKAYKEKVNIAYKWFWEQIHLLGNAMEAHSGENTP
jgi:hypothetical protein